MALHLRPSAPIAPDALLPGDPARALFLAQELLVEPKMSNHSRGLWGYYGKTETGTPLTIQSTGMGGPSAAIVFRELADAGMKRAIRVGTCGALAPDLKLGDAVIAEAALSRDGTSRAHGAEDIVQADPHLVSALLDTLPEARSGLIASTDLFYEVDPAERERWIYAGAVAVEMETATLFALAPRLNVQVACILLVSDTGGPEHGQRISDDELESAARRVGAAAAAALET